jgi:hypothetical protein
MATLALKGQALASGASHSVDVAGHVDDLPGGVGG